VIPRVRRGRRAQRDIRHRDIVYQVYRLHQRARDVRDEWERHGRPGRRATVPTERTMLSSFLWRPLHSRASVMPGAWEQLWLATTLLVGRSWGLHRASDDDIRGWYPLADLDRAKNLVTQGQAYPAVRRKCRESPSNYLDVPPGNPYTSFDD
jgi:hypothetical protein